MSTTPTPAPTAAQPTVTTISHPSVTLSNTVAILDLILSNLEADAPAIIQISPTTKTASILAFSEIGIAAATSIMAALEAMKTQS
jgi:hypothetical protein